VLLGTAREATRGGESPLRLLWLRVRLRTEKGELGFNNAGSTLLYLRKRRAAVRSKPTAEIDESLDGPTGGTRPVHAFPAQAHVAAWGAGGSTRAAVAGRIRGWASSFAVARLANSAFFQFSIEFSLTWAVGRTGPG
jgi:hypothetical protein